jgi:hypothetical protein
MAEVKTIDNSTTMRSDAAAAVVVLDIFLPTIKICDPILCLPKSPKTKDSLNDT